jgi:carbon-monoxide dehydrogenase medium subunit
MGGTDCFVRIRDGVMKQAYMVDVKGLEGMKDISFDPIRGLTIGAAVNMNRVTCHTDIVENYPLLAEAARTVASYQLRTRATIVGNICNASPAGDTIGACLAYDGQLKIHGVDGERTESLSNFFKGPGRTTLKPGDIVTSIFFPIPPVGAVGKYIKLGRNKLSDLSIVGVTVMGYPDGNTASGYSFRIALASVAPVPLRTTAAEETLAHKPLTEETIAEAAQAAMDAATPIDDVRGSARYRKYMVRNLTREGITYVWNRLQS